MKELIISKELVSEVLGLNVVYTESCEYRDGIIGIWTDMNTKPIKEINIYEFAFKCKEWALTKGYFIYSTNELSFIKSFSLETIETFSNGKDTEIECILKAGEYILKEINDKDMENLNNEST